MSRQRSTSVLDSVRSLVDKDLKAQMRASELNAEGNAVNFFAKSMDKKVQYFIRVEPEGIRYAVRPKDKSKRDVAQLEKLLETAALIKYTSWRKFRISAINDTIRFWTRAPNDARPGPNIDEDDLILHGFSCRQTAEFKKLVHQHLANIKASGGIVVHDLPPEKIEIAARKQKQKELEKEQEQERKMQKQLEKEKKKERATEKKIMKRQKESEKKASNPSTEKPVATTAAAPAAPIVKGAVPSAAITLGKEIGRGSGGIVFQGTYAGHKVAVKQLHSETATKDQANAFVREAGLMMILPESPNIVRFYGICNDSSKLMLVMEWVGGGALDSYVHSRIAADDPLSNKEIYNILLGIARGMAVLAANNIIHRDLAARNVLLDENNQPKVSDFGYSRMIADAAQMGQTHSTIGPVRWMAPESLGPKKIYSEKSDVWMFGATAYEIIMGEYPYANVEDMISVGILVVRDRQSADMHRPLPLSVPKYLHKLVSMCFDFNPDTRPSFAEITKFLEENPPGGHKAVPISSEREYQEL